MRFIFRLFLLKRISGYPIFNKGLCGFSSPVTLILIGLLPILLLLSGCANPGASLGGGPKDETPPKILSCIPSNFSTHFNASKIEITFDEYFDLKDINKQLVVSPPMAKKPEFKKRGRMLEISFRDSLLPDRTYTLNFGDALVDLNEGNPIKNYQYVFSTGASIDSLEAGGKVIDAVTGKPSEDVQVMLYSSSEDSLPLTSIPVYISRTNKEGMFRLKNLAGGSYKIFALKDGNTNLIFDSPAEAIGFLDSLVIPKAEPWAVADTAQVADTIKQEGVPEPKTKTDTVKVQEPKTKTDTVKAPERPKYRFTPDSLQLRLFTEMKPNQYLASTERTRKELVRMKFNEGTDSIGYQFLNLPADSVSLLFDWYGDADTLDIWLTSKMLISKDSLLALITFPVYDSLERRIAKTDTVKMRYRAIPKAAGTPKNEFSAKLSVESTKTLEYGSPVTLTTALPCIRIDTTLIRFRYGKDSLARPVPFRLVPDTLTGIMVNGTPLKQPHPRNFSFFAPLLPDTTYRLTLFPGALTGISGQKNDTLNVNFKMKAADQYGTLNIDLPKLQGHGVVELTDGRNKVVGTKRLNGPGKAVFELLAPGKYTARLIFDTNGNGKWDTGRYLKHIQPERVIPFTKEINLKANWEVSETWVWQDE